jgi:hypothetical protein
MNELPLTRVFATQVLSGTGRYTGASGKLRIALSLAPHTVSTTATAAVLSLTAHFAAVKCPIRRDAHGRRRCLGLLGTINGFATEARPQRFIADGPTRYTLTETAGEVSPLGQVTVEGTLVGTGLVRDGHPRLWMRINNHSEACLWAA